MLYGGNNNWFATYAYWLLRYLGFDRVKLMDGGRKKWELEERELVDRRARASARPTRAPLAPVRHELRAFRDDVLAHIGGDGQDDGRRAQPGRVLAARCWRRRTCRRSRPRCPGHIPGAANVPWASAAREDGSFKSDEELTALYGGVGRHRPTPT